MEPDFDKTIAEMRALHDYVNGKIVDKVSFTRFVEALAAAWHKIVSKLEGKMGAIESSVNSALYSIENDIKALETEVVANSKTAKSSIVAVKKQLMDEMRAIARDIDMLRSELPEAYNDSDVRSEINAVRASIPQVVTLQEVWDRFDSVDKKLKALADTKPSIIRQVFGGGRPVHVPMVDDLSGSTNGSNKTFYLSKPPRSLATLKIWGSDFPYILRSGVDFTVSGKTITLTTDAPSSGSNLVAEYYI